MYRKYSVRSGLSGQVIVEVPLEAVRLRGEREAVAQYAWLKLMGKNELGDDVNKKSPTRDILMDELLSRYEPYRYLVYDTFKEKIRIKAICNTQK